MFFIKGNNNSKPPLLATFIIILLSRFNNNYEMRGDLEEEYSDRILFDKRWRVKLWYWEQVLTAVPEYIINFIRIKFAILHNYLLTTYRHILKAKWYFTINVAGLSIGLISSILILLWVENETSYEKHIPNSENIYRVTNVTTFNGGMELNEKICPPALAAELKNNFEEILNTARLKHFDPKVIKSKNKTQIEENIVFADKSYFEIINHEFVLGNKEKVFSDLNTIVISEKIAERYFPNQNPIGEILTIDNKEDFVITAVIADVRLRSIFDNDFILPFKSLSYFYSPSTEGWDQLVYPTYVQVDEKADINLLNKKIENIISSNMDKLKTKSSLQKIEDIHLYYQQSGGPGIILNIYILSSVAVLILIMANLNFINLALAKSTNRAKEIGHRKVIGANRKAIMTQFYIEVALIVLFSLLVSLAVIYFAEPQFHFMACAHCYYPSIFDTGVLNIILITSLITILISGFYPALFLSRLEPAKIFKGKNIYKKVNLKKSLVMGQLVISFILLSATIIINEQADFIRNNRLGFDRKKNLMYIPLNGELKYNSEKIKTGMKKNSYVLNLTSSSELPNSVGHFYNLIPNDTTNSNEVYSHLIVCDNEFISTLNIKLIKGRFFNKDSENASPQELIINLSASKKIGYEDPIGEFVSGRKIVGMVDNFHSNSLYSKIQPISLVPDGTKRYLILEIKPGNSSKIFESLEESWDEAAPDYPFDMHFLSGDINKVYQAELDFSKLISVFSVVSIFIACIGLIGLSSFVSEKREKEISVRKVLGASNFTLVSLIMKDFIKWTIIASLVAAPLSYYFSYKWLNYFAYHVGLQANFLYVPFVVLMGLSIFTVGIQAFITTIKNPISGLSSE